jgi:hypothetical protein
VKVAGGAAPDRDNARDPVLAGRHHCGNRCVLGAEARAASRVQAYPSVDVALKRDQARGDVAEQPTLVDPRSQPIGGRGNQILIQHVRHVARLRQECQQYRWAGPGRGSLRLLHRAARRRRACALKRVR